MVYLPIKPQWAPAAIPDVEKILNKNQVVLEWGNGCSTPWVAQRVKYLFAVDDDINWSRRAEKFCQQMGIDNVDFSVYQAHDIKYLQTIWWFSEMGGIDVAIVDGLSRVECFKWAAKWVKPGGLIILDDSQREEYGECFNVSGLEVVWIVGAPQTTTLFRKKK